MNTKQFLFPITVFLKGIGQIMLQENPWTGLLFMAGVFCGSKVMGLAIVIAVITGTLTAKLFKYDKESINAGLYGFSAALVGVALVCFFQPSIIIWIAIIVGAAFATIIQHLFMVRKIPVFTFPFIIVTWLFLTLFYYFPALIQPQPLNTTIHANNYLALCSHGFGQVIFQDNIAAGILFIIGVLIGRPVAAIYGIISIALSTVISYWLKESVADIFLGLLGYNAVLCAITFAGNKLEDLLSSIIAVLLSVIIMIQMRHLNVPALTFPFVLSSWLTLITKTARQRIYLKLKQ